MRASCLSLLCTLPLVASAATSLPSDPAGFAYRPKFARQQNDAGILDFSLCTMPRYPSSSLRNGEQGTVELLFIIAPTGRTVSARVRRTSGFPDLDDAALKALSMCRFRPASIDNVPVQGTAVVQYKWVIE